MSNFRLTTEDVKAQARGHWPEILASLGKLERNFLENRHGPCPACGGKDRYRFDDRDSDGGYFCNQCGAGDGFDLLQKVTGWDFAETLREVARLLGMDVDGPPAQQPRRPAPAAPAPPAKPKLTPVYPVPDGTPAPTFKHWKLGTPSKTWEYRDAEGRTLLHVCRFELPEGGKDVLPYSWCLSTDGSAGWRWKGPTGKRPIFGLDELAKRPNCRSVLLVEGEKTAAAAAKLTPRCVVVTWLGGTKSISRTDWSPLQGRSVAIWPDADDDGIEAVTGKTNERGKFRKGFADLLHGIAEKIQVVTPPSDVPKGWDLADAAEEGWDETRVMQHLTANIQTAVSAKPDWSEDSDTADAPQPTTDTPETQPPSTAKKLITGMREQVRPVGYDEGRFYYLPKRTNQVVAMSAAGHTRTALLGLAPLAFWERNFAGDQGPEWLMAANALIRQAETCGVYDPGSIRGRGAWWDDGRVVLHLGNRLVIDGKPCDIADIESERVYQSAAKLAGPNGTPMDDTEAIKLMCTAEMIQWERPASAALLCGWVVLSPICGALKWRPHVWLSGGAGSGKTTVLSDFVVPLLGSMGHHVQGESTEPGVRQTLKADAMPVVFDEAEQNEKRDNDRIQMILGLMRQASSESGAIVAKGTASGEAKTYKIRAMFCLASISAGIKQLADTTRISVLGIKSARPSTSAEREAKAEHWKILQSRLAGIDTDAGRRLVARTVQMIPVIRENADTFAMVAAREFGSQRIGDQYGHLLAGAYSLLSRDAVTEEQAAEFIHRYDWKEYVEPSQDSEEERLVGYLRQHEIRVDGEHRTELVPVGELIEKAMTSLNWSQTESTNVPIYIAEQHLLRLGLKITSEDGKKPSHLAVSNSAVGLQKMLNGTPWANNWAPILRRIEGAEASPHGIRFGSTVGLSRATMVPIDKVVEP